MNLSLQQIVLRLLGCLIAVTLQCIDYQTSIAATWDLFEMKLESNGLCLYPTGKTNGSLVNLVKCGSTVNTWWKTVKTDNRSHRLIQHSNTGKCLDVKDWSTSSGAKIQIWDCHSGKNQRWSTRDWYGTVPLENVNSGKCIDYSTSKATIQQYDCHFRSNQRWNGIKW
jgi:hypothetical protein